MNFKSNKFKYRIKYKNQNNYLIKHSYKNKTYKIQLINLINRRNNLNLNKEILRIKLLKILNN